MKLIGALVLATVIAGCGGEKLAPEDAGVPEAASAPDAASDVWTQCSAPSGARVCNGPANCFAGDDRDCDCLATGPTPFVTLCTINLPSVPAPCPLCDDANVCVRPSDVPSTFLCASFDTGVLFAENGGAACLRYGDLSSWTGASIPEPVVCADAGASSCGGACGTCAGSARCIGRSPTHPQGLCIPPGASACTLADGGPPCPSGQACFVFQVDPAAQPDADDAGVCLPVAICASAAAALPGGGRCVGG